MTLYELMRQVANILTPESDKFYNYMLHTFDDNGGFLRTRYCWWDECVADKELPNVKYNTVVLTMQHSFTESLLDVGADGLTSLSMQLHYDRPNARYDDDENEFDFELGYTCGYYIDLKAKTFCVVYTETDF